MWSVGIEWENKLCVNKGMWRQILFWQWRRRIKYDRFWLTDVRVGKAGRGRGEERQRRSKSTLDGSSGSTFVLEWAWEERPKRLSQCEHLCARCDSAVKFLAWSGPPKLEQTTSAVRPTEHWRQTCFCWIHWEAEWRSLTCHLPKGTSKTISTIFSFYLIHWF